jgi:methyl-accepting chemotaxis protein
MENKYKRRNFFIKKELQGRYILSFFIFVIFGSVLYASIFSMLSADSMTIVYKDNNLTLGQTPAILLAEMLKANWILILSGGVLGVIVAMFLSHRVAGPIFNLERSISRMAGGDLSVDVRLREKDEGKELAAGLNELRGRLVADIRSMIALTDAVDVNLKRAAAASGQEEARAIVGETKTINEKLKKILNGYTTDKK